MVSPAPTPPLSPYDESLLTAFVTLRYNLLALSQQTSQPLLTLKDWALQPHIQTHIKQFQELAELEYHAETTAARSAGIKELESVIKSSQDPIERRRAAQTLIRVGMPQPTARRTPAEPSSRGFTWRHTPAKPDATDAPDALDGNQSSPLTPPSDFPVLTSPAPLSLEEDPGENYSDDVDTVLAAFQDLRQSCPELGLGENLSPSLLKRLEKISVPSPNGPSLREGQGWVALDTDQPTPDNSSSTQQEQARATKQHSVTPTSAAPSRPPPPQPSPASTASHAPP